MQIDLANTLVHKVYFVYHALFIIARKLGLPSFGGVGGGFRGLGEAPSGKPPWRGRTIYLYLIKIKIHLMINSLVSVLSPFQYTPGSLSPDPSPDTHPRPLPKGGETELAGNDR